MPDKTFAEQILDFSALYPRVMTESDSAPCVTIPNTHKVESLERFLATPKRKRGVAGLGDVASFCDYVKEHKQESTRVFAEQGQRSFVGIIDFHSPTAPAWGQHMASLTLEHSPEWATWYGANKRQMEQKSFGEFIEDNLPDILKPDGADMLEIATTFSARSEISFKKGVRLDNQSDSLQFVEKMDAKAGRDETLEIPRRIELLIPVFVGEDPQRISARFKYCIRDGRLTLWFELERVPQLIRESFETASDKIEENTGVKVFQGRWNHTNP